MKSLLLLLISFSSFSNELLDYECSKFKASLKKSNLQCLELKVPKSLSEQLEQSSLEINKEIQQWIWLSNKIDKAISHDKNKLTKIENLNNVFSIAKNGYVNPKTLKDDYWAFRMTQDYIERVFKLVDYEKEKNDLTKGLNLCYSAHGFHCSFDQIDTFKEEIQRAETNKIAILMSYPLLSHEDILEEVSSVAKDMKNFDKDDIQNKKNELAKALPSLFFRTSSDLKEKLNDKVKKWNEFYGDNLALDSKTLNKNNSRSSAGGNNFEKFHRENSELISEILLNSNLEEEFSNPLVGKSVCSLHKKNKKYNKIKHDNEDYLDAALFVAPFALGPIGMATKLASLGKLSKVQKYSKYVAAGSVELGLLGADAKEISEQADICEQRKLELFYLSSKDVEEWKINKESVENCTSELSDQLYISLAATAIAPLSLTAPLIKKYKFSNKELKELKTEASKGKTATKLEEGVKDKNKALCRNMTYTISPGKDRSVGNIGDPIVRAKNTNEAIKARNKILNDIDKK